jgi:hypothetical protein
MHTRIEQALRSMAAVALLSGAGQAHATLIQPAPFQFVSESAQYDSASNQIHFQIVFNQPPDFLEVDEHNRSANAFQYFIFGDRSLTYPDHFDSIIRGEEIRVADGIRIRNAAPTSLPDDVHSGGWGTIRGTVPYSLSGSVLRFTTPLHLISDVSTSGILEYQLETYVYGATTRFLSDGRSTVLATTVPEPGTGALLALGGAALWLARQRKKRFARICFNRTRHNISE